jgi:hypothetical protein
MLTATLRRLALIAAGAVTCGLLILWYSGRSAVEICSTSSATSHLEVYVYDGRVMVRRFAGTYQPLAWQLRRTPAWAVYGSRVDAALGTAPLTETAESWRWTYQRVKWERPKGGRGGSGGYFNDLGCNWPENGDLSCRTLIFPIWAMCVPLMLFWCIFGGRRIAAATRKRRRIKFGLCTECGYDLRASVARCPECGALTTRNLSISHP